MREFHRPSPSAALRVALFAAMFAAASPVFATSPPRHCSQLAHDQGVTGLEPGLWISSLTAIAGFVFFVVDAKPDGLVAGVMADLVGVGPYITLSFAAFSCVVTPDGGSSEPGKLPEFTTRDEARAHHEGAIRGDAFIMGLNMVSSGVMLIFVHKPASRIALGISTAFPVAYSLLNLRKFSPDRGIDDILPGKSPSATLELVPEIERVAGEYAVGLGLQGRF